uniref:Uncharacterized protein n=1 Tax=Spumella elongata TaxID=89044 RepID=A0A7S3HN23_9STRA
MKVSKIAVEEDSAGLGAYNHTMIRKICKPALFKYHTGPLIPYLHCCKFGFEMAPPESDAFPLPTNHCAIRDVKVDVLKFDYFVAFDRNDHQMTNYSHRTSKSALRASHRKGLVED